MIRNKLISLGLATMLGVSLLHNKHQKDELNTLNDILLNDDKIIKEMTEDTAKKDEQIEGLNNTINEQLKQLEDKDAQINQLKEDLEEAEAKISVSNSKMRGVGRGIQLSADEVDMLARLIEAEAGIEPYEGKVAVANVVFNRMEDSRYPDTLKGVIYQPYQFSGTTMMYDSRPIGDDCYRAVQDALNGVNPVGDAISFWADYLDQSNPLWDLNTTHKIGGHYFTNEY